MKNDLFGSIDEYLVDFLLADCPSDMRNQVLQDYDEFSAFTARRSLDYLNNADANNKSIPGNGDSIFRFLRDITPAVMNEYANRKCDDANSALRKFVEDKRNAERQQATNDRLAILQKQKEVLQSNTSLSPSELKTALASVDSEIQATLSASASNNSSNTIQMREIPFSASSISLPDNLSPQLKARAIAQIAEDPTLNAAAGTNNLFVESSSSSLPVVDDDSLFKPSIVSLSTVEEIENIPMDTIRYSKCFNPDFTVSNYIVPDDGVNLPLITPDKVDNLKRIHYNLLIPIFEYYKDKLPDGMQCGMKIVGGLTSIPTARGQLLSSTSTKHKEGLAVNFTITGIDKARIIDDIVSRRIDIPFGIIAMVNGIYITLPFSYENYLVERLYLDSPTFSSNNIYIEKV
jgi:hypothetical protein